jgi:Epoxide hydrolase N terminus
VFSTSSNTSRREMLAATAAGGVMLVVSSGFAESAGAAAGPSAIRPFHIHFADDDLVDLRRRLKATRLPERETVNDTTQGVRLATIQALARYWTEEHDWRKCEAYLNGLPQFITEIDGLGRRPLGRVMCAQKELQPRVAFVGPVAVGALTGRAGLSPHRRELLTCDFPSRAAGDKACWPHLGQLHFVGGPSFECKANPDG